MHASLSDIVAYCTISHRLSQTCGSRRGNFVLTWLRLVLQPSQWKRCKPHNGNAATLTMSIALPEGIWYNIRHEQLQNTSLWCNLGRKAFGAWCCLNQRREMVWENDNRQADCKKRRLYGWTEKPRFKMVLTAVGEYAYRRPDDGVIVCPICCLKPW